MAPVVAAVPWAMVVWCASTLPLALVAMILFALLLGRTGVDHLVTVCVCCSYWASISLCLTLRTYVWSLLRSHCAQAKKIRSAINKSKNREASHEN